MVNEQEAGSGNMAATNRPDFHAERHQHVPGIGAVSIKLPRLDPASTALHKMRIFDARSPVVRAGMGIMMAWCPSDTMTKRSGEIA
jgi:hypothetical protein